MDTKEIQISRKKVYDADFIKVFEDQVMLPNKQESIRVVVDHVGAAAIIPLTANNEVILVKQFRYAIGEYSIEMPAGKKDCPLEKGLDCAIRELQEETGYTSDSIEKIGDIYSAIGFSNERIELFVGRNAYPINHPVNKDPEEWIECLIMPLAQAKAMIKAGEIKDAKTIIALHSI